MVFTIYPVVLAVVSIILAGWMYGLGEDGRLLIVILVVPWLVFFGCLGIVFGFKYELVRVSMGHMEQAFTRAYYSEVPQFSRRLRMAMPNNLDLVVALLLTIAALTAMIVLGSE